ncbi:MAG: hypothetical protein Q9216_002052 [Gyalolechia sp. 2 TL-2023]
MAATSPLYHAPGLDGLVLGRIINTSVQTTPSASKHSADGSSSSWRFKPGTYKPKQLIESVAPLLDSLITQLGRDRPGAVSSHAILIGGLRSCLAISGRESTLPMGEDAQVSGESTRTEMASQAEKIGSLLVRWASDASSPDAKGPQISIRSSCEGHVWTRDAANLLFGPRSNGNMMQVYNEWLHQIVLLRDGLLPFENFEEVPLLVNPGAAQGTRSLEEIRPKFLMQILAARVKRTTLIDVAKVLTAPNLPSGGYGFQYAGGIIMPVSLLTGGSSILLRHVPAVMDDSEHRELLLDYENKDYFSVPREVINAPDEVVQSATSLSGYEKSPLNAKLVSSSLSLEKPLRIGPSPRVRYAKLCGTFEGGTHFSVDLGQITRGLQYAYRISPSVSDMGIEQAALGPLSYNVHKSSSVLSLPNLVTSDPQSNGFRLHVIHAGNAVVRMALLGKLYPENIVLLSREEQLQGYSLENGKGFGPQFIIIGGEKLQS